MTLSDKKSDRLNLPRAALAFHKIQNKFSYGVTNYSPERFFNLIEILKDNDYNFYNIDNTNNKNSILITIDDGYKHLKDILLKLIESYNITPIVFIPTAYIGKTNSWDYSHIADKVEHFDKSDIAELSKNKIIFGSHTHSHKSLTFMSHSEASEEMKRSKDILEQITAAKVTTMSYPFGHYKDKVGESASNIGYTHAFTMRFPFMNDSYFDLGRYAVYSFDSPKTIIRKLNNSNVEKIKASLTNKLSTGTVILNKLRGR